LENEEEWLPLPLGELVQMRKNQVPNWFLKKHEDAV